MNNRSFAVVVAGLRSFPDNHRDSVQNRFLRRLFVLVFLGAIVGGSCAREALAGTLEIEVRDHRQAIGDFAKFEITIDKVLLSPKPGLFWQIGRKDLMPTVDKVDLTLYTGKRSALIFRGEVTPGTFEAIHLKLKAIKAILKKNGNIVPVKNVAGPIKLLFSIQQKGKILVVLDLTVLDISEHPSRGYELHIKGYELYSNGKLEDKVPPG